MLSKMMKTLETLFEKFLWKSRLAALVGVVASLLIAFAVMYLTTVDVAHMLGKVAQYASPVLTPEIRDKLRLEILSDTVEAVDGYLLASAVLILALGLYELFVSKIEEAEHMEVGERLLRISSLDDLKSRLANVVILMLVVKFFQQALKLKYETPLDLLYLALGTLLMGGALFLSHRRAGEHG
jgi:uncharacterized membrane protein YqhA